MTNKFNDLLSTFDSGVTVRELNGGNSIISGFGNGIRLSGVFNESMINANLSNKNDLLYNLNQQNVSLDEVKESLSQIVNMFVKSRDVLEGIEDFDASAEDDIEEKELLLDDTTAEPVVSTAERMADEVTPISTSDTNNTHEIEVREEPIPETSDLEGSLEDILKFKTELNDLADKSTKLLAKFAKDDHENRIVAVGLIAGLYSISEDISDFIEDITEKIEDLAAEKSSKKKATTDKKENLVVPAKVDYMKNARGSVSQACAMLKKAGECTDLIDILKDVKSEMVIRQK